MTTIDTAAAWRAQKPFTLAGFAVLIALGLAGCETSTNLLASGDQTAPAPGATAAVPAASKGKVTIAPVIGAPDAVSKQLQAQLTAALERQNIGIAKAPTDKSDFTLRGYVVSAREKQNTKVSYIWDVTDPAGKRVNRITGEELIPGAPGKDPWAAVSAPVSQTIADKTASSLATWLPSQAAIAGAPAANAAPVQVATASPNVPLPAAVAATGSIARSGPVMAVVPDVSGAPGDGGSSLREALRKELSKNGVSLAAAAGAESYSVEGKVVLGEGKDGKQPIQIDWNVKDPQGKKLGTVSQKNEIPQGSLDGPWGKTADAAASAAAQGILKLLPPAKSVN